MTRKVAYSCFVDAKPKFENEVVRWLWSLTEKLNVNPKDIYITCDPAVSDWLISFFNQFNGLNITSKPCFTQVSRPANKWLQLGALCDRANDYSHFVVTDCDKVFVEFASDWCDDSVRACKFIPRPTFAVFEDIFKKYDCGRPRFTIEKLDPQDELRDRRSYVNNHNGGLIIFPSGRLVELTTQWKRWIDRLLADPQILRKNLRNLDQVAFAMTMQDAGSDINFLPTSFDLGPNITGVSEHELAPGCGQLVLHVHGRDDEDGRILCGDKVPEHYRQLVERVNSEYINWKNATKLMAA